MTRIHVKTEIRASPETVWADLRDIVGHVEWMHDAESITFTSSETEGVGTTFDCATRLGPLRLIDKMEITVWAANECMGVRHVGLVAGRGRFTLTPTHAGTTLFAWDEELFFPWWMGGPLGGAIGAPLLRVIWRRNLRSLAARFN